MRNHLNTSQHQQNHNNMESQGVQQLLVAEKRAAEKVCEAKKRKVRRIKQAREEAEAEIERYKTQRETQFIEYEKKYMGNSEDIATKIEHDAEMQLQGYEKNIERNKEAVIEDLISYVIDIKPVAHPNYFILKQFNKM